MTNEFYPKYSKGAHGAYKVSEITKIIKDALETLVDIWVEGEISNLRIPTSGHIYFTIKDEQSQIRCVVFKYSASNLRFLPKDGMKVLIHGKIGVYEKNGDYQIVGDRMLSAGVGELQLAFERLKDKLQKEGLFDKAHKKPIPLLPKRVGVVTSPTGAAVRDIIKIINRRFENMSILTCPVMVQGIGAAEEIANAIRLLNELNSVDVIIVGRGGGSVEDLWAFNEEVVARSIYESKIPVISAVGHEIDYTIADYVADLRAPTPSAAAELVVPEKSNLKEEIFNLNLRLSTSLQNKIATSKKEFQILSKSISSTKIYDLIGQHRQRIDALLEKSYSNAKSACLQKRSSLKLNFEQLNALSPLAVLQRGYSICLERNSNRIVKDFRQVDVGEEVKLILSHGTLDCKITDKGSQLLHT